MEFRIKNIHKKHYKEICEIGTKSYPKDYYEGEDSFFSKIDGCYEGCYLADLDGIVGYIISFPYFLGKPFPIDSHYKLEEGCNCWYIHDICVIKEFRNKNVATKLAKNIIDSNLSKIYCLTSVMDSKNFWEKLGFRSFFKLKYCSLDADYMILIK